MCRKIIIAPSTAGDAPKPPIAPENPCWTNWKKPQPSMALQQNPPCFLSSVDRISPNTQDTTGGNLANKEGKSPIPPSYGYHLLGIPCSDHDYG